MTGGVCHARVAREARVLVLHMRGLASLGELINGNSGGQFNRIIENIFEDLFGILVMENISQSDFFSTKISTRFSKRFSIILLN